jgi:hypothetical protein
MCPGRVLELRDLSAGNVKESRPASVGFSFMGSTHSSGVGLNFEFLLSLPTLQGGFWTLNLALGFPR